MGIVTINRRHAIGALVLWLACLLVPPVHAQAELHAEKFAAEIAAFERSDQTNPPPQRAILFIGSSSIRIWKTLARDFPNHQVINRGFGGSFLSDSVYYFDRIVTPYHPRQIVLYAGANDINAKKSPEQVCADFKAFVQKVHEQLPETRVLFISIGATLSRQADLPRVRQANELIRQFITTDPKLQYVDVFSAMLKFTPEYYLKDRLHMTAKGYAVWKSIISPYLE